MAPRYDGTRRTDTRPMLHHYANMLRERRTQQRGGIERGRRRKALGRGKTCRDTGRLVATVPAAFFTMLFYKLCERCADFMEEHSDIYPLSDHEIPIRKNKPHDETMNVHVHDLIKY